MAAADSLANDINNLHVSDGPTNDEQEDPFVQKWGLNLEDMYKIALSFFKENEGKALQLTYKDKLRLIAYMKQVAHGKYTSTAAPAVGFLDVVGNDRRQAWQALGDLSRETSMSEFVQQLHAKSPLFKPYVEESALKKQRELEELQKKESEKKRKQEEEEALRQKEIQKQREHDQELQIRAALNQQTASQFQQYVQEQYPYNPQLQDALIQHLQEQHYQQYMQQVYQQQLLHQQQQQEQLHKMQQEKQAGQAGNNTTHTTAPATSPPPIVNGINGSGEGPVAERQSAAGGQEAELPPLAAASMWTRKNFKEFKDSLRNDKDSVINIGSGESVTVRVPTHEEGTCLFWEFATDYYDIGFGVYFEWTISPSNTVSVHVSESSDDEEELEEEEDRTESKGEDVEKGGSTPSDKPPTDEIIPVYRRDCHEEVYCGSHVYPGKGVYLLKFDNSYSLWRSKTLYYRVYYSR